jgi:hypothetical protein
VVKKACATNGQRLTCRALRKASLGVQNRYGRRNTQTRSKAGPMPRPALLILVLALAGCQPANQPADQPPDQPAGLRQSDDLSRELVRKTGAKPPSDGKTVCWADDVTPAIIETVTEQVQVQPEVLGPDGAVVRAAVFESKSAQRIVQDRRDVWFRTPCAAVLTLDFVASLQRALKARGFYTEALTGQLDAPTRRAIRLYQAPLGLDSERLSLAAARRLGIAAGEFQF